MSNAKLKRLQKLEQIVDRSHPAEPDYVNMSTTEIVRRLFRIFRGVDKRTNRPFRFQQDEEKLEAATDPVAQEQIARLISQKLCRSFQKPEAAPKGPASENGDPGQSAEAYELRECQAQEIGGGLGTAADPAGPRL